MPRVFLSYARSDAAVVRTFADKLRAKGLEVSLDVEFLRAGERWDLAILAHIEAADAFIYFASPEGLRSTWVGQELTTFIAESGRPVVPVLLGQVDFADLPPSLARRQGVAIHDPDDAVDVERAATAVAADIAGILVPTAPMPADATSAAQELAGGIAESLRHPQAAPAPPDHVFLVHGHDLAFRDEVDGFLAGLGVSAVILAKAGGAERSLLDRFETLATRAQFAIVLLSPDDYGAAIRQYDARRGGAQALRYRARQNVVLELGFFYGRLGWERVIVIEKAPPEAWPEFERPSDLAGAVFVHTGGDRDWRTELHTRLIEAEVLQPST